MTVLDDIIHGVKADLAERQTAHPLADITARAHDAEPALPFLPVESFGLICEVKRSSPSKGHLAAITDPAELAQQYEAGGALAISVLTERRRFNGSLDDLGAVKRAVHIPVLRKDFIVTDYQVFEARAWGADLVLLMVSALDDARLSELTQLTTELGMTPLIETHTEEEMARTTELVRGSGIHMADLIGINARNLKDLTVDTARFAPLAAQAPAGATLVGESGVNSVADIEHYARAGAHVVLTGEALVTAGNPREAVEQFTTAGRRIINLQEGTHG